jgi:hypothetical protein
MPTAAAAAQDTTLHHRQKSMQPLENLHTLRALPHCQAARRWMRLLHCSAAKRQLPLPAISAGHWPRWRRCQAAACAHHGSTPHSTHAGIQDAPHAPDPAAWELGMTKH